MSSTQKTAENSGNQADWVEVARELGAEFAEDAAVHDESNLFVMQNYERMKDAGLFSMLIPQQLGGGGASMEQLGNVIRELGRHCGSTALSYSMHSHPVALNVFKHLKGDEKATATLSKIASKNLVIAGTGANDWLASSGTMTRVDGGYQVTARKHFVSGGPGAQVFVTSSTFEGDDGKEVIHFTIPFSSEGVIRHENWNTLGMRGTGSHDISLENVFVPDEAVVIRRPAGSWHPMWNAIIPTAMPLIMSAYMGLADAAKDLALEAAERNPGALAGAAGELENRHTVADLAIRDMIRINANHGFAPSNETTSAILARKTLVAEAARKTVELSTEIVGGMGFFKGHPLERIARDIRASHFHPLPYRRQYEFSGRVSLGLDPVDSPAT